MTTTPNNSTPWSLNGTRASLSLAHCKATIEFATAELGLTDVSIDAEQLANTSFLNIVAPNITSNPPVDVYVRERDLIATYEESTGQRRRLQAYWRAVDSKPATEATVLELVVSVQTDLLDSQPAMYVASRIPASEILRFAVAGNEAPMLMESNENDKAGFVLVRPQDANVSFMQAAHPTDFAALEMVFCNGPVQQLELRHPLFAEPLEKGVIRRARIRLAILPRAADLALATTCYRDLATSEPMLTV